MSEKRPWWQWGVVVAVLVMAVVLVTLALRPRAAANQAAVQTPTEEEGEPPPTGKPTVMPDVEAKELVTAIRELQAAGFYVNVDVAIGEPDPRGVALKTDDHPGDTMHEGDSVILMIALPRPADLQMNDDDAVRLSDQTAARLREQVAAAMKGRK